MQTKNSSSANDRREEIRDGWSILVLLLLLLIQYDAHQQEMPNLGKTRNPIAKPTLSAGYYILAHSVALAANDVS